MKNWFVTTRIIEEGYFYLSLYKSGQEDYCVFVAFSSNFLKFDFMQLQIDIEFDQSVQFAKKLPSKQWAKLKHEAEEKKSKDYDRE